jgi:hypothetical protein
MKITLNEEMIEEIKNLTGEEWQNILPEELEALIWRLIDEIKEQKNKYEELEQDVKDNYNQKTNREIYGSYEDYDN